MYVHQTKLLGKPAITTDLSLNDVDVFLNNTNRQLFVMSKGLVDYADEFDVEFLNVYSLVDLKEKLEIIKSLNFNAEELYFGTNEYIKFQNYEDFVSDMIFSIICEKTYKIIKYMRLVTGPDFVESAYDRAT